jgi:ATP-binding cassette subfamily C (CFTR/MRP) protein 1
MMALGYRRPLQPTDLWHIDPSREASLLSSNLDAAFLRRQINANEYNARLLAGEVKPPLKLRMRWALLVKGERRADEEREWRRGWGRKRPNLGFAIVEQFNVFYLSAIIFKIFGDACQLCVRPCYAVEPGILAASVS